MSHFTVFDGHCDTAFAIWETGQSLQRNSGHVDLERALGQGKYAQIFAFCTYGGEAYTRNGRLVPPEALLREPYAYFCRQTQGSDLVQRCSTPEQAAQAMEAGKAAAFVSLEGAEGIGCDPGRLEELAAEGFCMAGLTWNGENALAGSHLRGGGLTAKGKAFVRRAQQLGIAVDVSHCSDRAFWDICEIAEAPIVASHSNSRTRCPNSRNLTDEMFRAICDLGGTAGINLYADFLGQRDVTLDTVYAHIDHFMELGGENHVALGGDLDGCDKLPQGFQSVGDYHALAELLMQHGYGEKTVQGLFCDNLMEVLGQCVKKKR